jgi:hypothetical protein
MPGTESVQSEKISGSGWSNIQIAGATFVGIALVAIIVYLLFTMNNKPGVLTCADGSELINGQCFIKCSDGKTRVGALCVPPVPTCTDGQELINGECLIKCADGITRVGNVCVPPVPTCIDGSELINGECLIKCADGITRVGNVCVPPVPTCTDGQELINGECLIKCADGITRVGKVCVPPVPTCTEAVSPEHVGYPGIYRGWYDTTGCGKKNRYCRWVGDSGNGGDPLIKTTNEQSWWSCTNPDDEYGKVYLNNNLWKLPLSEMSPTDEGI